METPTGLGCPACARPKDGEGITAMLFNRAGGNKYYCRSGHEYLDMGELLALNPAKLQVPQRKTLQPGHETFTLQIPTDLRDDLLKKFGTPERLTATLAGVLRILAEKSPIMVNEEDADRIEKITGIRPKTGSELVGLFYERDKTNLDLRAQLENKNPNQEQTAETKVPEGSIVINCSTFIRKASATAKFRNEKLEAVLEQTLKLAFDNGWA